MTDNLTYPDAIVIGAFFVGLGLWWGLALLGEQIGEGIAILGRELGSGMKQADLSLTMFEGETSEQDTSAAQPGGIE